MSKRPKTKKVSPPKTVKPEKQVEAEEVSTEPEILPPELLEDLPPEAASHIRETFLSLSGPMQNPIARKVTGDHITQLIENSAVESKREHDHKANGRLYTLVYVVLGILVFFGLAWMFAKNDPELFKEILKLFTTFAAGLGVGWGFKSQRTDN